MTTANLTAATLAETFRADPVAGTIALAALLVALGVIGKAARGIIRWFRMVGRNLRAIEGVVQRELDHNHGSSLKDDVTGMAVAIGALGRQVDDLRAELHTHLAIRAVTVDQARHRRTPDE